MLSDLCVRRPVFATMLVMSLVVLGTFSFRNLGVDLFPKADPATVSVTLTLPGASPDEMSTSVVEPMEEAISGVSGIDELQSRMAEGRATVTVRFVLERDINDASNDVREKVASAIRNMPPALLPPVITKVDPDADPVMSLIVSSAGHEPSDPDRTRRQTDRAGDTNGQWGRRGERARRACSGNPYRRRRREAQFVRPLDHPGSRRPGCGKHRNARRNGRARQRTAAAQNARPGRRVRGLQRHRRRDEKRHADPRVGHRPRRRRFERPISAVWLGKTPAVMLDIRRAMGENTVAVIEGVRAKLATIQRSIPSSVKVTVIRDDSKFIYASISSLEEHLIFGALFATIVVMFFIRNIRAVIISAVAIPASIISSFTLMNIMGFTLNNMTLLGITLAVGIVIDDAIVVLENIFRYIEEKECTPFEAAIQGTREVALAVMATTLSLVVIFLPIAFMNGYAKRFINPFGWTMAFAIMVSMLVSFTLTPMLSSRFLKLSDADSDRKTKERGFFHWLDSWYGRQVNWALDHPGIIIGVSVITALLTLPLNRMVGREFVPNEDMGEWIVHVDAPEGTSLRRHERDCLQPGERTQRHRRRRRYRAVCRRVGEPELARRTSISSARRCRPTSARTRRRKSLPKCASVLRRIQVIDRASARGRHWAAAKATSRFRSHCQLLGPDLDQIAEYSKRALTAAQKIPSLTEPKIALNVSNPEIHVAVDRKRAADLGVRMATIGNTLRLAVSGDDEISFYKEGQEQYPVKIRVLENQRGDIGQIGRLTVPSANGPVRIDNIAQLQRGLGPTTLQRSDRQFAVMFISDIAPGHALDEATNDVRKMLVGLDMPPTMSFKFQGQSKILDETTANMIMAISLAMIFVYMVLASQFESFLQPVVIMLVLPIAVPFALFTLWATGRTLNLWSALGMLLLLGIVKKNSILQVDYANVLRHRGLPMREAIVESCRTRLRPILMTTTAIIAGLIPTSLGIGIGGTGRAAIAVTIIGGQALCLFLTLLLVPVAYVQFDALEQMLVGKRAKEWLGNVSAATFGRLRPASDSRQG